MFDNYIHICSSVICFNTFIKNDPRIRYMMMPCHENDFRFTKPAQWLVKAPPRPHSHPTQKASNASIDIFFVTSINEILNKQLGLR